MKILTAIFGTGVYFYAGPILFQYGYNSYFGIPVNFIEPSIRDNIIFFFDLSRLTGTLASSFSFWIWVGLIVITLVIWFLIAFKIIHSSVITLILVVLTGLSLYGFYVFGNKLASINTEFKVLPEGCISSAKNITYIIPSFYETTAIIVPVSSDTHKLTGSFLTRDSSELKCDIQNMVIGPISK